MRARRRRWTGPRRTGLALALVAPLTVALAAGCGLLGADPTAPAIAVDRGGDATRGRALIAAYGCGACHRIPGITGADALVGPPLDGWPARSYIAGTLLNNEVNLVRWLTDPQDVRPGTAMPDLDLDEEDARDIAAYLLTRS
jgi:cytochrome c